jgi:hypothetical protein
MHIPAVKISGLIILLTISLAGLAQKTDKVFLKNGDILTGEIKSLKFAKLSFDMDGPGLIQIKWELIVQIKSDKKFQIIMRKEEVLVTSLDSIFFESKHARLDDIVEIVQIKDRFLKRLDGDLNVGFNYAKSNKNLQFNFSSSITYRKPKMETNLKLNSAITQNSSDSFRSRKQDATIDVYRKLNKSFYVNGVLSWQENTELGIKNRYLFTVAGGQMIINNNHRRFLTGVGLSYNVEQSSGAGGYTNNLEALLGAQFKEFRYLTPKISIDAKFLVYPGITDWGRLRMDFQLNSKFEIFKDFNIGLSFYDNYDNRPPQGASSKNDFGINFTLGYEFGK